MRKRLVKIISSDSAQMDDAEAGNDSAKAEGPRKKIDELDQKLGPEYLKLVHFRVWLSFDTRKSHIKTRSVRQAAALVQCRPTTRSGELPVAGLRKIAETKPIEHGDESA